MPHTNVGVLLLGGYQIKGKKYLERSTPLLVCRLAYVGGVPTKRIKLTSTLSIRW
jgi:hypothetical protein